MNEEDKNNEEVPFSDSGEFDPNLKNKISVTGHDWKQQGYEIHCYSCTLHHGTYIGPDRLLVGIDDKGYPQFAKRS